MPPLERKAKTGHHRGIASPNSDQMPEDTPPETSVKADGPPEESREDRDERLAFYTASINAWFSTAIEHDKNLLTLATGGIGLLTTLATTVGISSKIEAALYFLAMVFFIVCIVTVQTIFKQNKNHIEQNIHGNDPLVAQSGKRLACLDRLASGSFIAGILLAASIGFWTGFASLQGKGTKMADNDQKQQATTQNAFDSVHGMANLQKSFQGMTNLKPQGASQVTSVPAASGTQPSSSTPQNSGKKESNSQ